MGLQFHSLELIVLHNEHNIAKMEYTCLSSQFHLFELIVLHDEYNIAKNKNIPVFYNTKALDGGFKTLHQTYNNHQKNTYDNDIAK